MKYILILAFILSGCLNTPIACNTGKMVVCGSGFSEISEYGKYHYEVHFIVKDKGWYKYDLYSDSVYNIGDSLTVK